MVQCSETYRLQSQVDLAINPDLAFHELEPVLYLPDTQSIFHNTKYVVNIH